MSGRGLRLGLLVAALVGCLGYGIWERDPDAVRMALMPAADPPSPTHVFIILDTVRQDRTSVCGFEQPTTPTLERLAAREDAQLSCRAYTPGDWTLPSHASFFTGVPALEHRAHGIGGAVMDEVPVSARPLDASFETMAETFTKRGYQTLSVSANPILSPETGLTQGFDVALWGTFAQSKRTQLLRRLRAGLIQLDPSRPLFVFVNITDTHGPLVRIPEGHPWLEHTRALNHRERDRAVADPHLRAHLDALYSYGVEQTDSTLAGSLELLSDAGWLDDTSRIVITSDHGELLGEHGMVGHGSQVWEENNRVIFLAVGPDMPELPETFNAMEVHPILLEGALRGFPVESSAFPMHANREGDPEDRIWLGEWIGTEKWTWNQGETYRTELATDPKEQHPIAVETDRFGAGPEQALKQFRAEGEQVDEGMIEMLRAAGYID